jgi:MFS superfamily sulfate permease-like transporter
MMISALIRHAPSVVIGVIMHVLGPKNLFWVIALVGWTVGGSYLVMWLTGTTLQRAQGWNWFLQPSDLAVNEDYSSGSYGPPLPFGVLVSLARGDVYWEAAKATIPTVLALAFLYVIRCSLHSAALKKNIRNVTRKRSETPSPPLSSKKRAAPKEPPTPPKPFLTLGYILEHGYGYSQLIAAIAGGIAVAPSVAASLTLFKLGAESKAPQFGSCVLVLLFYLTNFQFVQYIPKPAFSCLMVLAGLDMIKTWVVGSFLKTQAKMEWMVAPLLVVLAFTVGMLTAIFLGVAISTFIFVATFYRVGTVKFVGSGLTLRSTVERGFLESR